MTADSIHCVALDFETTGFTRGEDAEPWQLGMIRVSAGRPDTESHYETLLKLPPLPRTRSGTAGEIAPSYSTGSSQLTSQWPELKTWWTGTPLAAHNIATEKNMLERIAPLQSFGPWIDTLVLSKCAYPNLKSHALGDVCEKLKLLDRIETMCPGRSVHDALYDATACAVLLEHLVHLPAWSSCSLDHLVNMKPKTYYKRRKRSALPDNPHG